MADGRFRRLLTGLDTVEAAYYLHPISGAAFSFEALMLEKERLRASGSRDGTPVELGDRSFLLRPYGTGRGFPLVLENAELTIECGEFNTPSFFVTFRSFALWQRGARALHQELLAWTQSVGLVPVKMELLSRVDFTFDYWLPVVDFDDDNVVSLAAKDGRYRENRSLQTLSGVLAPHAKLRSQIVPSAPVNARETCDHHTRTPATSAPARMSWACLLKRVFDIDIEHCPRCGGRLKIIAAIVDPQVIV